MNIDDIKKQRRRHTIDKKMLEEQLKIINEKIKIIDEINLLKQNTSSKKDEIISK